MVLPCSVRYCQVLTCEIQSKDVALHSKKKNYSVQFSWLQVLSLTDVVRERIEKGRWFHPFFFLSFLLRALPEKTWTTQDTKTAGGDATLSFGLRLFKTSGPSHSELFLDCTHTQHVKGRKINTIKKDQKHRI